MWCKRIFFAYGHGMIDDDESRNIFSPSYVPLWTSEGEKKPVKILFIKNCANACLKIDLNVEASKANDRTFFWRSSMTSLPFIFGCLALSWLLPHPIRLLPSLVCVSVSPHGTLTAKRSSSCLRLRLDFRKEHSWPFDWIKQTSAPRDDVTPVCA